MGGGKGADSSGVANAQASAQAAQQEYQLGEQQLQWAQQQWGQEFPIVQDVASTEIQSQQEQMQAQQYALDLGAQQNKMQIAAEQQQMQAQQQSMDFASSQEQFYENQYVPMQEAYNQQAMNWASPEQLTENANMAMANVTEATNAQLTSAQQQLEGFGVNPGATRFAGLNTAAAVQAGAASAGAGTNAITQTKLQQMGLESGAINTGQGLPNQVNALTGTGVSAGSAAAGEGATAVGTAVGGTQAGTAATGSGTAAATNLMGALSTGSGMYTAPTAWYNSGANNMNVYTNAVNGYNQAQAQESAGMGSMIGGIFGSLTRMGSMGGFEGGGPIEFQFGGPAGHEGSSVAMLQGGGPPMGPTAILPQPQQPGQGQPMMAIPPRGGTPGGFVGIHQSPSGGQAEDDVDAKLTVGEFVIPKDVVNWEGQKRFVGMIDNARRQKAVLDSRGDIGGEAATAIPSRNPAFVSRPNQPMPNPPMGGAAGPPPMAGPPPQMAGPPAMRRGGAIPLRAA